MANMTNPNNTWKNNPDMMARAVEYLSTTDMSSADIARAISKEFNVLISRNSVIGFVNRAGKSIKRIKVYKAVKPKIEPRMSPARRQNFQPKFKIHAMQVEYNGEKDDAIIRVKSAPIAFNKAIGARDPYGDGCRWLDDANCACGQTVYNRSYCKMHYQRSVERYARRA
jgi:hypothetical protein